MKKLYKGIAYIYGMLAYAFYTYGLLLLFTIQKNKYAWMKDFDPTLTELPEDSSGNSILATFLLMVLLVLTQIIIVFAAKRKWVKALSGVLVLLAIAVWTVRFGL